MNILCGYFCLDITILSYRACIEAKDKKVEFSFEPLFIPLLSYAEHSFRLNFLSSLYTDLSFGDTGDKDNNAVLHSRGRSHRKLRQYRRSLTMPGGNDIQDWFKSLPIFTRYWLGTPDIQSSSEDNMFYQVWTDCCFHSSRSVLPSQPSVVDPVLGNIHHKVTTLLSSRD